MIRNQPYFQVRLIPGMSFTCYGTITGMIVIGEKRSNGSQGTKLSIWREDDNECGFFYKSEQEIFLSLNICSKFENYNKAFNCQLPVEMRVPVRPGDFLGIEQPRQFFSNFELYSVSVPALTNYIFYGRNHNFSDAIDLSMYSGPTSNTQPLILIRVNQGMHGFFSLPSGLLLLMG